jgi:phage/plasmid-like protein (TIGR03299 family)
LRRDLVIGENDLARRYLLLSNSHDGLSSLQVKITPVRVVCNNTLTVSLSQGGTIRIRHDRFMTQQLDKAKELLGLVERRFEELEQMFSRMNTTFVAVHAVQKYLRQVFPDPVDPADRQATAKAERLRLLSLHLSRYGKGNADLHHSHSIWTALNGVTELIDHRKPTLRGADLTSRRLNSVWFGQGAAVKARALRLATEWLHETAS